MGHLFNAVFASVEAFNKEQSDRIMVELILEEEQQGSGKQSKTERKRSKLKPDQLDPSAAVAKFNSGGSGVVGRCGEAGGDASTMDGECMRVVSVLVCEGRSEWASMSAARLREWVNRSGGPGVVPVSEKRMKKIKAWMTSHPSEVQALSQQGLSGSGHGDVSVARQCDHCGATAEEAGLKQRLLVCSGCGAARYCSAQCQKAAWKGGHKKTCGL